MTENNAIDLALRLYHKHLLPNGPYDDRETAVIQAIADLYKAGYEVVPAFRPAIALGGNTLEQMKQDGVIY